MAIINFNAATVEPDAGRGDPIAEGWYNLMVDESEVLPTNNNATTGNAYLKLRFTVLDGTNKGRKIFSNFNIKNDNPTAQEIAYKQLSAVAHAVGVLMVQDSQQLHGIPLKGRVKIKKGGLKNAQEPQGEKYDDSNEITMYKNINEPTPEVGAAKPAVAAPTMGAFPTTAAPAAAAAPNPAQWATFVAPAAPAAAAVAPPTFGAQPWDANAAAQATAPAAAAPVTIPVFVPPVAQAPAHVMLPAANGVTYEAYIAAGWTDAALIQNGMMAGTVAPPPAPPAPPAAGTAPPPPAAAATAAVAAPAAVAGAQAAVPPWARGAATA